ncbi:MAG: SPFH domain-containing protein [Salinisphaeraceae bacterium]|nr:SPFH domain-containing protein [Salinisphaeraceae bacterium]
MIGAFSLFVATVFILAVVGIFLGVKSVPQGFRWTVERFGRFTRQLEPGLHFIVPFVDRIGRKVNVMEQVIDIPSQDVITKDNAQVSVDGVVYIVVSDAAKAAYEVNDLHRAIVNLTMTSIRSVLGEMDLDEALSNRDTINGKLLHIIDEATSAWGTNVRRVEIKDISPPQDLVDSMARQMKAEREKRAVILEAEGRQMSEIKIAEGEKRAAILQAEGRLEAARKDAEARERLAQAEAKATTDVSLAVKDGNVQALNYFVATKYTEALQAIGAADNQKVMFLPIEASSLIGSVAGIKELVSQTQNN